MPKRRRIVIEKVIDDPVVDNLRNYNIKSVEKQRKKVASGLSYTVQQVVNKAERLYNKGGSSKELMKLGLLPLQQAYEYLRNRGYEISFRAFGGRIERGSIPSVKFGRKRYIPVQYLEDLINLDKRFYGVRQAYELYKKYDPNMTYRAFIGRVEKGSLPSVKIGSRRLIPAEVIDGLVHVAKNYYTVSQAIKELHKNGIRIKRNAFERRLDRGRIPCVKIGGRRYISKDILDELIEKEKKLK